MKIKKYVVREMHEALRLIREEMGPDAVIINSYRLPRRHILDFFRPPQLEVTAAVDELPPPPAKALPEGRETGGGAPKARGSYVPEVRRTFALPPEANPLPAVSSMAAPFSIIFREREEAVMEGDKMARWRAHLLRREVAGEVVENLLQGLEEVAERGEEFLRLAIKERVAALVAEFYTGDSDGAGQVLAFLGPTGAGKTTTLAKLATWQAVFEQKKVALVTVYSHRFGTVEEIRFYGQMIDVPVEVVMTPAELARALEAHRDKDFIFVDTEGISWRNAAQLLRLKGFVDALPSGCRTYLVLSAATRARDLLGAAREFGRVGFTHLILTKLDETDAWGSALNLVLQARRPLAYITNGQNIPDDISAVTPQRLASLLFDEGERYAHPGL